MKRLVYNQSETVIKWAEKQLDTRFSLKTSIGIGIINDDNYRLMAGVVYHNFRAPKNIEMSIASVGNWSSRSILKALFNYPFNQLGCSRVTTIVDINNTHTIIFLEKVGFIKEGIMRDANPDGDAVILGLLKTECRWI